MLEKNKITDLAIFGNPPIFEEKLHVGRPNIGDPARFLEYVNTILNNRWLSNNGPYVQKFEQRLSDLLGVKHCIPTCNGTVALEIAIRASQLSGEVIVPSFTFIATAHALQWQEITPVFCDIDPETHTINPNQVKSLITPRTSGILGVHIWGNPCHIDQLSDIAQQHNLKLIFDASHAFGCSYNGRMIGNFGSAEVFSFHATKFVNTLEGGAIATNDDLLAEKVRLMKNFGFAGYDKVIYIGTNGKMNEISAAMGLTSLEAIDSLIETNNRNYDQYQRELSNIPGIRLLSYDKSEKCNFQYIVAEVDSSIAQISRDQLIKVLWAENILARRYFYPGCHRMEPYSSYFPHAGLLLPKTESVANKVLILPTGQTVTTENISAICQVIHLAITNSSKLVHYLETIG